MASVQFRGAKQIIEAFQDAEGQGWAILENKRLLFKGIGENSLQKIIENFCNSASNSVYILNVYEDIEDRKKIKYNTEPDASFGFRLHSDEEELSGNRNYITKGSINSGVMDVINGLKDEIAQLKTNQTETEDDKLGIIGQIFEHPILGNYAGMLLGGIMSSFVPGMKGMPMVTQAAISGIPAQAGLPGSTTTNGDAHLTKMTDQELVNQLRAYDPLIKEHLWKILQIAIHAKPNFDFFMKSLDSMQ